MSDAYEYPVYPVPPKRERPIFCLDTIVTIRTGSKAPGLPIDKPLWIREIYIPSAKNRISSMSRERSVLYLLKDGPREDAKDLGWASEESLIDWSPPESLIDMDPAPEPPSYEEAMKE